MLPERPLTLALALALLVPSPMAAAQRAGVEGVVQEPSGRPVPSARVTLEPHALATETDSLGRFRFSAVLAGSARLTVSRIGYRTTVRSIEIVDLSTVWIEVRLELAPVTLAQLIAHGSPPDEVGRLAVRLERGDLAGYGGRSAGDLLAELGVGHVTARGAGSGQAISLRGARPEGVLVLLDGAPLNDPITGAADLSLVPVEALESVRVVPGTGSAHFGPGAVGGVVLLRRRSGGSGGYLNAGWGSYGWRTLGAGLGVGLGVGTLRATARMSGAANDYPFTLTVHPDRPTLERRNADTKQRSLGVLWTVPGRDLELSAGWVGVERGVPGPAGSSVFDQARLEVDRADVGGRGRVAGWSVHGRAVAFRHAYRDPVNPRTDGTLRSWGVEAGGLRDVTVVGSRGTWLLSVRSDWASGVALSGRPQRSAAAAGLSLSSPLGGGAVSLALRADLLDPGGVFWSPEAAATVGVLGLELHGRVSRGLRAPTFADLYFASPIPMLRPAELDVERVVLDAEAGFRLEGPQARLGAAAYYRDVRDAIVWAPSSFVGWRPGNVARVLAHGAEVSAGLDAGPFTLDVRYEWSRPRFDLPLNQSRLPYVPEHQMSAHLRVRAPADLRLGVRHLGRRTAGLTAGTEIDPVTAVDAAAWLPLRLGDVRAGLGLEALNLLGAAYELVPLYPMPGRELRVTTRLRWEREEETR